MANESKENSLPTERRVATMQKGQFPDFRFMSPPPPPPPSKKG